jgi:hypothetical protein
MSIEKIKVFDNGGKTFDRYTVVFPLETYTNTPYYPYIAMSGDPTHPLGFGQHGEIRYPAGRLSHLGKRIKFSELPEACQRVVLRDLADMNLIAA